MYSFLRDATLRENLTKCVANVTCRCRTSRTVLTRSSPSGTGTRSVRHSSGSIDAWSSLTRKTTLPGLSERKRGQPWNRTVWTGLFAALRDKPAHVTGEQAGFAYVTETQQLHGQTLSADGEAAVWRHPLSEDVQVLTEI